MSIKRNPSNRFTRSVVLLALLLAHGFLFDGFLLNEFFLSAAQAKDPPRRTKMFDPTRDLLLLHYDHAPDKDDGQSAAADRTILQSKFSDDWIKQHVVPVSGAYGINKKKFNPDSDAVMDAVWNPLGGWLSAHEHPAKIEDQLVARWQKTLEAGGDIWIKEGGQSDITARIVRRIKKQMPTVYTPGRVHLVQHGGWNEQHTTPIDLAYVKRQTEYLRIPGANRYLRRNQDNDHFVHLAKSHPRFGPSWKAAFAYCNPKRKLDFSDTGELMYILALGEMNINAFQKEFLEPKK